MPIQTNSAQLVTSREAQNSATIDATDSTNQAQTRHASAEDINRFNQALASPNARERACLEQKQQLQAPIQTQTQAPTLNANNASGTQNELSAIFSQFMSHNSNNTTELKTTEQNSHFDPNLKSDSLSNDNASLQAAALAAHSFTATNPNTSMGAVTGDLSNAGNAGNVSNIGEHSSVQDLIDHMVERILVADPKFSQGSEVRLLLGTNTGSLQGSEIILHRNLEGMLAVEINCRNQNQFKKFVEIRNDLKTALEQHEDKECQLLINRPEL